MSVRGPKFVSKLVLREGIMYSDQVGYMKKMTGTAQVRGFNWEVGSSQILSILVENNQLGLISNTEKWTKSVIFGTFKCSLAKSKCHTNLFILLRMDANTNEASLAKKKFIRAQSGAYKFLIFH